MLYNTLPSIKKDFELRKNVDIVYPLDTRFMRTSVFISAGLCCIIIVTAISLNKGFYFNWLALFYILACVWICTVFFIRGFRHLYRRKVFKILKNIVFRAEKRCSMSELKVLNQFAVSFKMEDISNQMGRLYEVLESKKYAVYPFAAEVAAIFRFPFTVHFKSKRRCTIFYSVVFNRIREFYFGLFPRAYLVIPTYVHYNIMCKLFLHDLAHHLLQKTYPNMSIETQHEIIKEAEKWR